MNNKARRCHKKLYDLRAELYFLCKEFLGEMETIELFEDFDVHFDYLSDNINQLRNSIIRCECEIKELLK